MFRIVLALMKLLAVRIKRGAKPVIEVIFLHEACALSLDGDSESRALVGCMNGPVHLK